MKKEDIKKDLAKKDLRDELNGIAKRRGRGRTPEEQKEIYAKYHKNKSIVFKREKGNHNTLILFPSVNDESLKKDYYNMGGNSAFIYVHDIAKKIGRTAKLRPDMDHGDVKFYDGVCSIEGLEKFTEKMEKLGAERFKVTGTEIIVFKLPREYTDEEIRSMRNREQEKLDQFNSLIFAKVLYPDVHKIILELQRTIPIRVKKMDREYRALAGGKMFSTLTELSEMYVFITRGHIEAKKGANEMLQMVASLLAQLSLFCELKIFDATTAGRIAKSLVELEYLLKGKIINKK